MGADPVAFVTAGVAATRGRALKAFSVRKEAKDHGGGGRVAGALDPGDKVVVTEDTVTRGTSLLEAVQRRARRGRRGGPGPGRRRPGRRRRGAARARGRHLPGAARGARPRLRLRRALSPPSAGPVTPTDRAHGDVASPAGARGRRRPGRARRLRLCSTGATSRPPVTPSTSTTRPTCSPRARASSTPTRCSGRPGSSPAPPTRRCGRSCWPWRPRSGRPRSSPSCCGAVPSAPRRWRWWPWRRRRSPGRRAGLIAAVITALYPVFLVDDGALLAETLVVPLVALVVWAFFRLWHRPVAPAGRRSSARCVRCAR